MGAKLQIAVLSAVLAAGGFGVHRTVHVLANKPSLLYLAAQYKLMTGDADAALRLFRKAVANPRAAAARPLPAVARCVHEPVPINSVTTRGRRGAAPPKG